MQGHASAAITLKVTAVTVVDIHHEKYGTIHVTCMMMALPMKDGQKWHNLIHKYNNNNGKMKDNCEVLFLSS